MAQTKVTSGGVTDSSITNAKLGTDISAAKLATGIIPDARFPATLPAISGANLTNIGETKPTIGSISPSVITNAATAVTLTGTNYISVPQVQAISSTGAIVNADSITYTSATTIVATFTLTTDGTYYLRVENNDGNAVRSSSALLTVSDLPAWVSPAAGSIGTFAGGSAISTQTFTATDATSFAITSGAIATGLTFNTGVGSCTITGTQTQYTAAATNNFTIRATDAQGQTADRAYSMSWSFSIGQGGQFN